jgi:outer membrane receptor protein involved in Fe transport
MQAASIAPAIAQASAEPVEDEASIADEAPKVLEVVTVTARRVEESASTVPLTIRVIDGDEIVRSGITGIVDVARLTPGLTYDLGGFPNDTRPAARGMQSERGRPSVAVMLDGLDLSGENIGIAGGTAGLIVDLLALDRIEIVKGPQTTLFGRSAFAGAINYIAKKPSNVFEGDVALELSQYSQRRIVGTVSGPLVDDVVSYRVNAAWREGDGLWTNPVNGGPLGAEEFKGLSGSVRFTPSDAWDITLRYQTSDTNNSDYPTAFIGANTRVPVPGGTFTAGPPGSPPLPCPRSLDGQTPAVVSACTRGTVVGPIVAGIDDVQMGVNEQTRQPPRGLELSQDLASVDASWDTGAGTLRYTFGWITSDSSIEADGDYTNFPAPPGFVLSLSALQQFETTDERFDHNLFWTQSLGAVDILVGAQVLNEESSLLNASKFWLRSPASPLAGPPFFLAPAQASNAFPVFTTRDTDYKALYGALKWRINDTWRLGVEARLNSDDIRYVIPGWTVQDTSLRALRPVCLPGIPQGAIFAGVPGPNVPPPGTVQGCPRTEILSDDEWTPRVTLDWLMRDDVMLYANVAKGFKPGGFNTLEVTELQGQAYLPEFVTAYEVGAKGQWLDSRLSVDLSVFYNDYTDQQIGVQRNQVGAGGTVVAVPGIVNAASVEAKGFELAAEMSVTYNLKLTLGYAYTDATFGSYVQGPSPTAAPDAFALCGVPEGQTSSAQVRAEAGNDCADFSGNAVAKNPKHALGMGALYRDMLGTTNNSWFVELTGQYRSKRFVDEANLSWMPSHTNVDLQAGLEFERFSIIGFVTNLTDDDTIQTAQRNVDPGNPEGFAPGRSIIAYLPEPRVAGLRFVYQLGL